MKNGIFISHSTENKDLAEELVDFLQTGMGIGGERIFCTSSYGALSTGQDFIAAIKKNMEECKVVIALITPEYLKSFFCMMELGAAWILSAELYPILAGGVEFEKLDSTPLRSVEMRKAEKEEDWFAIYDELLKIKMIAPSTGKINKKIPEFLKKIQNYTVEENPLIHADQEGYYNVWIESERRVPDLYRCYKIKGHLVLPKTINNIIDGESHWIFFKAGVYDELKVGEQVRLKIGTTELRHFADIGYARNIYPDELEIQDIRLQR